MTGCLGFASFAIGGLLSLVILVPFGGWIFGSDIADLFSDFVEADPPLAMPDIHRELAIHHGKHINENESRLTRLYWAFRGAVILLALEVVFLLLDVPR